MSKQITMFLHEALRQIFTKHLSFQFLFVGSVTLIQYSLLGRIAASTRLNTTFRGLAPSPPSVLPEDGDGASPQNVVFEGVDAAVRPRRLY
jgi:hypothetical protein